MKRIYGMAMLAALFALAAPAQDVDAKKQLDAQAAVVQKQMSEDLNTEITTMRMKVIGMVGGLTSNVKNAPYRADQITETTQTLGDGTRIHNEHTMTIYRDSQGRVRREVPDEISIMDPNSGVGYTLNTKDLTYRKIMVSVSINSWNAVGGSGDGPVSNSTGGGSGSGSIALGPAASIAAGGGRGENVRYIATQSAADGPNTAATYSLDGQTVTMSTSATTAAKKESLGTQTMEGVSAQGERRTSTIEAGSIGNDRPIQIVSERWYSPDLQMDVMTRHSDPRTGEEVMRLVNISRAEPDASLFVLPPGYQLVEGPAGRGGRGGRGGGQ